MASGPRIDQTTHGHFVGDVIDPTTNQPINPSGSGIPQGGPLTADLDTGGYVVHATDADAENTGGTLELYTAADNGGVSLQAGRAAVAGPASGFGGSATVGGGTGEVGGGGAYLQGGSFAGGGSSAADIRVDGAYDGVHGRIAITTDNSTGNPGEALVPNGAGSLVYGGIISAAGVPSGAPDGKLPLAYDSTAVTGGFYFWNGAAWVKVATIL